MEGKKIVELTLSAAAGACVGALVMNHIWGKRSHERMALLQERLEDALDELESMDTMPDEVDDIRIMADTDGDEVDLPVVSNADKVQHFEEKPPIDYLVMTSQKKEKEQMKPDDIREDPETVYITDSTFVYDDAEYGKQTCTFFVQDDILAGPDDSLEPMDVVGTIGAKILSEFKENEAGDVLYIRNEDTKTDYEVLKSLEPYSKAYTEWLGYSEEE